MPTRRLATSAPSRRVCLFAAAPAAAQPPLPGERIAAGVTAAGTDLAGLTVDEAAARLNEVHGARLEDGLVTVQAADITWTLKTADAVVQFDELLSAKRALYAGRDARRPARRRAARRHVHEGRRSTTFAARIDKRLGRPARDARLKISLRRVRVTHSRRGRDINRRELVKSIARGADEPERSRASSSPSCIAVKPKMTADKLRRSASTVITIEQRTFTLRLFKHLKVVKTYKVAVGQPQYPTPRGRFSITSKQVNPVWSVPNSPWAGELAGTTVTGGSAANPLKARWMGIAGGVGIHGTGEDGSIGTRASHGCIRMHVSDVIALYKRVRRSSATPRCLECGGVRARRPRAACQRGRYRPGSTPPPRRPDRAAPPHRSRLTASSSGWALSSISAYSSSASESITIAPPEPIVAPARVATSVRMTMLRSAVAVQREDSRARPSRRRAARPRARR